MTEKEVYIAIALGGAILGASLVISLLKILATLLSGRYQTPYDYPPYREPGSSGCFPMLLLIIALAVGAFMVKQRYFGDNSHSRIGEELKPPYQSRERLQPPPKQFNARDMARELWEEEEE